MKVVHVALWMLLASVLGCATNQTADMQQTPKSRFLYGDRIDGVIVSEKDGKMIFVSDKYHYIFNLNPYVMDTIKSSESGLKGFLKVDLSEARLSEDNRIAISCSFSLNPGTGENERRLAAKAWGFPINHANPELSLTLMGERFRAKGNVKDVFERHKMKAFPITVVANAPVVPWASRPQESPFDFRNAAVLAAFVLLTAPISVPTGVALQIQYPGSSGTP